MTNGFGQLESFYGQALVAHKVVRYHLRPAAEKAGIVVSGGTHFVTLIRLCCTRTGRI